LAEQKLPQKPDIVLIEAAINGDPDSFCELCKRHYPVMVAIAHSVLRDRHLAEDAAQQAFAKAAVKLPQLKKKSRFAGWLASICRNTAKNMARSIKPTRSVEVMPVTTAEAHKNSESEFVKEALNKLSARSRELIFLRYYDGMSYEQMSAALGISEQAINGRLRRAKKKLAGYLRRRGFGKV
jgi:RNA polymerase sigma-70 factor (ECF subfamily)